MKLKILFKLFCKVNGYRVETNEMTTILGSRQEMIVLFRPRRHKL